MTSRTEKYSDNYALSFVVIDKEKFFSVPDSIVFDKSKYKLWVLENGIIYYMPRDLEKYFFASKREVMNILINLLLASESEFNDNDTVYEMMDNYVRGRILHHLSSGDKNQSTLISNTESPKPLLVLLEDNKNVIFLRYSKTKGWFNWDSLINQKQFIDSQAASFLKLEEG